MLFSARGARQTASSLLVLHLARGFFLRAGPEAHGYDMNLVLISIHFSSRWYTRAGKSSYYAFHPVSQMFPQHCLCPGFAHPTPISITYLFVCLSICLSTYLSVRLSFCPPIYLSMCLSISMTYTSFCLSIYLSVCLSLKSINRSVS